MNLQKLILGFEVQHLTPYSDHCPISVKMTNCHESNITGNTISKEKTQNKGTSHNSVTRFRWKPDKEKFLNTLSYFDTQENFQHLTILFN